MTSRNVFFNMIVLTASTLALSGCVGAAVGIGAAAVTASSTEKGFSTSVSDGVIEAKLLDKFIQTDSSLVTSIEKSVNNGSVLMTGNVDTIDQKILRPSWPGKLKGCVRS